MFSDVVKFIRKIYNTSEEFIPLHEPRFIGNEKKYLNECIDSTYVSSVGKYVDEFEQKIAQFTGAKYAVATSNGTSALHISLLLAGVEKNDEVITQPLTFVATCNAITYCGASPIFVDVDRTTLGMSPDSLEMFLEKNTILKDGKCINKQTRKIIRACIPMHTFGHPCEVDRILIICNKYGIILIEDAAESLASYFKGKHTGTYGKLGVLSFNGNKIITSGGGGCIITNDEGLAKKAKHLTTTAKKSHRWEYVHDMVGYNYRMPNINAALLCAQLENIELFVKDKRDLAQIYKNYFSSKKIRFVEEPENCQSNYWLNAVFLKNKEERDDFLLYLNDNGIMTRPIWQLINTLEMYKDCQKTDLTNAEYIADRLVNVPSSYRLK
jgi:perosamine synthetase